jgi:hypothetical protein
MSMMDYNDPQTRQRMYDALAAIPANGKPPRGMMTEEGVIIEWLIALGFIEEHEQTKPCRDCGTPRPDYSYVKVSPAGRYYMAAMELEPVKLAKRAFLAGHGDGWRGNQLRRDTQMADAEKSWDLLVQNGAVEKMIEQERQA